MQYHLKRKKGAQGPALQSIVYADLAQASLLADE
jgi:hypothetical protein